MATLRDAQTSEYLADGSPLEMVALANELGLDQVLFDNVGEAFDNTAVLAAHDENIAGLTAASKDSEASAEQKASAKTALTAAKAEPENGRKQADKARKAMEAARTRAAKK